LNDFPNGSTSNATNMAKFNNVGIAEDQPIQLSVGAHSIVASYTGDPNYSKSTSNTLSVTITKAATMTSVTASPNSITSGQSVTLSVTVATNSNGAGPTGNVTFANGGTTIGSPVVCKPTDGAKNTGGTNGTAPLTALCTASLTTTISSLYPVPGNQPRTPLLPFVLFAAALAVFLGLVRWMPENRRRDYGYAGLLALAILGGVIAGCGGGGGGSSGGGGGGGGRTVTITTTYPGDSNYANSSSSAMIQVH
jgi:hypothetical protein